ncbi:bacteriohemerythrin [Noviherbaspirillum autotrophicum]|uniref:Hemerythrin-like domain-containing protein n=1 Tax=Noviherbaspirillum autotrophicum TaxID=709839 RepID=A0A0C1YRC1_9BURK|nr:bacteriohemerythrin [Noviherbaspirillum autotrophicum]KIF83197.1 hypothetical protein TSA66_23950 [Noviherbaspirillum autotrophicum]
MSQEENGKHAPFVIEWRKGFQVNIEQVDTEHQHLFALVKALNLASVEKTVEELLDYVVVHFSNEQDLMEKSGYPGFEQHLKLHEDFATHVADFLGNGEAWTEERVQELRRFLNKWLVGHIMTHDLRFGRWYTEHHPAPAVVAAPVVAAPKAHRGFLSALFGLK